MVCEDCKGTGKYVGFSVVEDCKKCEGKGSLGGGCDVGREGWYSVSLTETEMSSNGTVSFELVRQTGQPVGTPNKNGDIISEEAIAKKYDGGFVGHLAPLGTSVPANLGREELYELGRKGPYRKYVNFPVQLTEKLSSQEGVSFGGDDGTGHSVSLACETPYDQTESPKINLPLHHKSVSFTINNAEQNAAFKELMDKYFYPKIAKSMGIPKELIENPATLPSNGVS